MKNTDRIKAKIQALYNAEEFIRQHGEEGGLDEDTFPFPLRLYLQEKNKIANGLKKRADKIAKKYNL